MSEEKQILKPLGNGELDVLGFTFTERHGEHAKTALVFMAIYGVSSFDNPASLIACTFLVLEQSWKSIHAEIRHLAKEPSRPDAQREQAPKQPAP